VPTTSLRRHSLGFAGAPTLVMVAAGIAGGESDKQRRLERSRLAYLIPTNHRYSSSISVQLTGLPNDLRSVDKAET
jgi:hypothetical protein